MKCPSRWPFGNCALGQRPDQPPNSPGYAGRLGAIYPYECIVFGLLLLLLRRVDRFGERRLRIAGGPQRLQLSFLNAEPVVRFVCVCACARAALRIRLSIHAYLTSMYTTLAGHNAHKTGP